MNEIQAFIEPEINKIELLNSNEIRHIKIDNILEKLEPIVCQLLNKDFERLLAILYRLDVSEDIVKNILFDDHQSKASKLLSEAIIRRELVRKYYRSKYLK